MAYKTVPGTRRARKGVHIILHLLALLAGILGIIAVFKFKHENGTKDFVSLHTWLGIITISAYGLQVCTSCFLFFFLFFGGGKCRDFLPLPTIKF